MAESLSPADTPERSALQRRRSRNPIKNMMQHLSIEDPQEDGSQPRRESLIRRLSGRVSRSRSSTRSEGSASVSGSPDPALCQSCASWAADIEAIFAESDATVLEQNPSTGAADAFDKKEHAVTMLKGLEDDHITTTCPLCKLMWAVHVPSEGTGDYYLSGFSSRDTNYLIDRTRLFESDHPAKKQDRECAPVFLGVVPRKTGEGALGWDVSADWFRETGMLYRALPDFATELPRTPSANDDKQLWKRAAPELPEASDTGIWGREMQQAIDMNVAVDWLRYCKSHHHERCARRPVTAEMDGFRVIDCLRSPPQVVEVSIREDYVALSYVWGDNTTEAWPRVFRDAVTVTQELGLRYLWVDKICLDGLHPQLKMRQVSRMNEIYEGAAVTIIAAFGRDATYGLPGIGSTPRPEQPKYTFTNSNVTLVSSLPDPRLSVKNSIWYTRGWTYQEGFVARRRLIFTEHQMYWECEGMVCPESLVLPLDFYHDAKEQRMCDFMRPGLLNGVSYVDNSWQSWKKLPRRVNGVEEQPSTLSVLREVDQHIVDYTRRRLSREADSLAAYLGIARRLETLARGRLIDLVGIPVWPAVPGVQPRTRELFALSTSFWHHKEGEAVRRRRHLPSWTWAGWKGAVEMFSSIAVSDVEGKIKGRKFFNHHYVTATQLTRNEARSMHWTYAPEMVLLNPDGSTAWDFGAYSTEVPRLSPQSYALRVTDPLVLDKVKARTHSGGWIFNHLSVDVRLSGGEARPSIRKYVERHAMGEQMTVLWFVEETTVMLLVVEATGRGTWERVGRMRMGFVEGAREVMERCGDLEGMLRELPLRRLGEDIVIE